jgi:hypothetical protein
MATNSLSNLSSIPFIRHEAYRLLHRLCKECKIPRSKRHRVFVCIRQTTPKDGKDITNVAFNIISVTERWLMKNLTKREMAELMRLRLKNSI